jgi:hypothetical protein
MWRIINGQWAAWRIALRLALDFLLLLFFFHVIITNSYFSFVQIRTRQQQKEASVADHRLFALCSRPRKEEKEFGTKIAKLECKKCDLSGQGTLVSFVIFVSNCYVNDDPIYPKKVSA